MLRTNNVLKGKIKSFVRVESTPTPVSNYNAKMKSKGQEAEEFFENFGAVGMIEELPSDFLEGYQFTGYCDNWFYEWASLKTLPLFDFSNVTSTAGMFTNCISLETVPAIDTSSCGVYQEMFRGCLNLETIPIFDFNAKVVSASVPEINIFEMFLDCSSLSDESLYNILQSWINVTVYETYEEGGEIKEDKTKPMYMGLSEEQVARCKQLDNYQEFINKGWILEEEEN